MPVALFHTVSKSLSHICVLHPGLQAVLVGFAGEEQCTGLMELCMQVKIQLPVEVMASMEARLLQQAGDDSGLVVHLTSDFRKAQVLISGPLPLLITQPCCRGYKALLRCWRRPSQLIT